MSEAHVKRRLEASTLHLGPRGRVSPLPMWREAVRNACKRENPIPPLALGLEGIWGTNIYFDRFYNYYRVETSNHCQNH